MHRWSKTHSRLRGDSSCLVLGDGHFEYIDERLGEFGFLGSMIGFLVDLLISMMRITILKHLLSHGISLIYMLVTFPERFDYRRKIDSEAIFGLVSGQDASPGSSLSKTASYSKTYVSVILIFTKPRRMRGGCNSRLSLLCSHTGPLSIALIVVMQRAQNYLFFQTPSPHHMLSLGAGIQQSFLLLTSRRNSPLNKTRVDLVG